MSKTFYKALMFLGAVSMLAGCVSLIGCMQVTNDTATVSYDASMTPPMEVQRQADLQCAKVNKHAVRRKTSAQDHDTNIRYDDFDCVDNRS